MDLQQNSCPVSLSFFTKHVYTVLLSAVLQLNAQINHTSHTFYSGGFYFFTISKSILNLLYKRWVFWKKKRSFIILHSVKKSEKFHCIYKQSSLSYQHNDSPHAQHKHTYCHFRTTDDKRRHFYGYS